MASLFPLEKRLLYQLKQMKKKHQSRKKNISYLYILTSTIPMFSLKGSERTATTVSLKQAHLAASLGTLLIKRKNNFLKTFFCFSGYFRELFQGQSHMTHAIS